MTTLDWTLVVFALYLIPYYVAIGNRKRNATAIGALNVLLGWTVIGWIAALVWALSKDAANLET